MPKICVEDDAAVTQNESVIPCVFPSGFWDELPITNYDDSQSVRWDWMENLQLLKEGSISFLPVRSNRGPVRSCFQVQHIIMRAVGKYFCWPKEITEFGHGADLIYVPSGVDMQCGVCRTLHRSFLLFYKTSVQTGTLVHHLMRSNGSWI
jgi:hypothetical protein